MLDQRAISEIASKVARTQFSVAVLERILTEPATDSLGNDALRITVVLKPDAVSKLSGDAALDFLVGVQNSLHDEGEDRRPIIEYATENELVSDVESPEESGTLRITTPLSD